MLDRAIRGGKRSVDVAFAGGEFVGNVVAEGFVNHWTTSRSLFDVSHYGQFFVLDHREIDCVARRITVSGDNRCNRVTDEVDLVRCQHTMIGNFQFRQRTGAWHWSNLLSDIVAGVDRHDTRGGTCRVDIDAIDLRVRVDRTNKSNVQRARQSDVVDVVCQPANQSRILGALYSLANVGFGHDRFSVVSLYLVLSTWCFVFAKYKVQSTKINPQLSSPRIQPLR